MLARMWTRNFEVWAPPQAVVFHLWSRAYRHTVQKDLPAVSASLGICLLLGPDIALTLFFGAECPAHHSSTTHYALA